MTVLAGANRLIAHWAPQVCATAGVDTWGFVLSPLYLLGLSSIHADTTESGKLGLLHDPGRM